MSRADKIRGRYADNLSASNDHEGYIFSQRDSRIASLCYGERGHIGTQGCGVAAAYNAMKFIGNYQPVCEVIRDFEELGMTWLGARFGTKPFSLGRYFKRHGVEYEQLTSPARFKAALESRRIGIVCTWNPKMYGIHFYCVFFNREEMGYNTVNRDCCSRDFKKTELSEISDLRFITGYLL